MYSKKSPSYCINRNIHFENIFNKLRNFDRSLSYQVDLLNFSSLQTFSSYTLLKIWNNFPLELKQSTSKTMFRNKIMKTLLFKYLLVCNRINCFSCKQWYQLISSTCLLRLEKYMKTYSVPLSNCCQWSNCK